MTQKGNSLTKRTVTAIVMKIIQIKKMSHIRLKYYAENKPFVNLLTPSTLCKVTFLSCRHQQLNADRLHVTKGYIDFKPKLEGDDFMIEAKYLFPLWIIIKKRSF